MTLKNLLGTKLGSEEKNTDQEITDEDQPARCIFTPDIDRQMKEKDVFDSFLKIHFEKLMMKAGVNDSIMEESFVQCVLVQSLKISYRMFSKAFLPEGH